jgi:hypothetical protein
MYDSEFEEDNIHTMFIPAFEAAKLIPLSIQSPEVFEFPEPDVLEELLLLGPELLDP